jgi:hypothetical protein
MEQSDLLRYVCELFERLDVRYFVTGSQATIAFGEPRFTNDIDMVADLSLALLDEFCAAFPPNDYYLSKEAARQAIATRGMFNVIHPASGLKVDVIVPQAEGHDRLRLERGVRIPIAPDFMAVFTSPEDIILKKLERHKMGGGERHLRDIAGVVRTQADALDRDYIEKQAKTLGIDDLWMAVLSRLGSS